MVPTIVEFRESGLLSGEPFPEVEDTDKLIDGMEHILRQLDPTFGNIFHAMRDGYLDSRPSLKQSGQQRVLVLSACGVALHPCRVWQRGERTSRKWPWVSRCVFISSPWLFMELQWARGLSRVRGHMHGDTQLALL